MPKKIDEQLKDRAVRLVTEYQQEYPSLSAACEAVARQVGVGKESVRRWVRQAEVDRGERVGVTSQESEDIRRLKAENRRLHEDVAICVRRRPSSRGSSTPATAARCHIHLLENGDIGVILSKGQPTRNQIPCDAERGTIVIALNVDEVHYSTWHFAARRESC